MNLIEKVFGTHSERELKMIRPIVTKIEPAETFYEAEAYHQGFYKTNPERYAQSSTIRHQFLEENWK